ncbi:reverse transcriptase domain-containing protein [Tanacetum coccineum]
MTNMLSAESHTGEENDNSSMDMRLIGNLQKMSIQDEESVRSQNFRLSNGMAISIWIGSLFAENDEKLRVEDFQLGVESYQKKLNITKPDTYKSDLRRREQYTAYSSPKGFIYQNKDKKNILMRLDELHKFSNGTLDDVRTALDDRLKGIRMEYLPKTIWRQSDRERRKISLTLEQSCSNQQFFEHDKEDHMLTSVISIRITPTMRFLPDIVPSTSIKLMLFPFSLEGSARIWLEKEPPRSILTWDDLVSKFINQFFPPSKTTNLRNKITRFQQRFDESFYEAWDRFNDLLRACPHQGFSELHQLDTFYNALDANDQDSLNSAAGGNFLDKMPRECLRIIESKSKVQFDEDYAYRQTKSSSSRTRKSGRAELCNCGGAHSYKYCPATDGNVYRDNVQEYVSQAAAAKFNQGNTNSRPPMVSNQIRPPGFPPIQNNQNRFNQNQGSNFNQNRGTNFNQNRGSNYNQGQVYQPLTIQTLVYQALPPAPQMQGVSKTDFENYVKVNDAVLRNMQNQGQGLQNQMTNLIEMLSKFISSNTASSSSSGPSTPLVPTPIVSTPLKEPEQNPETSMDKVQKPGSESTAQVPPPEDQDSIFIKIPKPRAKKTIQEPNSPEPNSYQPKLPYLKRMKVR